MDTKLPDSLDYTIRLAIWETLHSTILRCAELVGNTTEDQVRAAQMSAFAKGRPLLEVSGLDRCDLAVAKLRKLAKDMEPDKPKAPKAGGR